MATFDLTLTDEQNKAVRLIEEWLDDPSPNRREFKLGGYAGTGKTTILNVIKEKMMWWRPKCILCGGSGQICLHPNEPPVPCGCDSEYIRECCDSNGVAVVAFTGKAVSVLRRKGNPNAQTLHSLMYRVVEDFRTHEVTFVKKPLLSLEEQDLPVKFVIVDEASMISADLYRDLLSYPKVKILWVGDPGQLEPVGEDIFLMRDPDYVLETIHRQAAGSSILQLAHLVRKGGQFLNQKHHDLVVCKLHEAMPNILTFNVVITGFNNVRNSLNKQIRELKGYAHTSTNELLVPGERIIVLRNNRQRGVFNGQLLDITRVHPTPSFSGASLSILTVDATSEEGNVYRDLPLFRPAFEQGGKWDEKRVPLPKQPDFPVLADYGYALTCHKSQGSEWERVLVIEPSWWGTKDKVWCDDKRWKYTAITRTRTHLTYCRGK